MWSGRLTAVDISVGADAGGRSAGVARDPCARGAERGGAAVRAVAAVDADGRSETDVPAIVPVGAAVSSAPEAPASSASATTFVEDALALALAETALVDGALSSVDGALMAGGSLVARAAGAVRDRRRNPMNPAPTTITVAHATPIDTARLRAVALGCAPNGTVRPMASSVAWRATIGASSVEEGGASS